MYTAKTPGVANYCGDVSAWTYEELTGYTAVMGSFRMSALLNLATEILPSFHNDTTKADVTPGTIGYGKAGPAVSLDAVVAVVVASCDDMVTG